MYRPYVFFTASTHRYEVLSNALKSADRSVCVPKWINTIRWSCRADASKAFVQGYPEIKNALAEFADNPNEVPKVRSESNGLYERMCLRETGIYSVFWNDILERERVNATSRKLQDSKLDLNAAVAMVVSLKRFVEAKRETFTEYERHVATLSGTSDYVQTRQRPCRRCPYNHYIYLVMVFKSFLY